MKHVITGPEYQTPIKPSDINATKHFFDAFRNNETEVSARLIVKFCQRWENWMPMTQENLDALDSSGKFHWNNLLKEGWVVLGDDGLYRVTVEFVTRCYASSPVIPDTPAVEEEHANSR